MRKYRRVLLTICLFFCVTGDAPAQSKAQDTARRNLVALRDTGAAYGKKHQFSASLNSYNLLLKAAEKANDTVFITAACLGIARNDVDLDSYAEGLKYCFQGLKLAEKTGDKKSILLFEQYAGYFYMEQGQYDVAIGYYQLSLPLTAAPGLEADRGEAYDKLGDINYQLGRYTEAGQDYQEALVYFNRAGSSHGIANTVEGMGDLYKQEAIIADSAGDNKTSKIKYLASLQSNLQGLALMRELKNTGEMALACSYIADIYLRLKLPARAKAYMDSSLSLALQVGLKGDIKEAYGGMMRIDTLLGDYKKAFRDYSQYILYRDSLINQQVVKQSLDYKMQYDAQKKEAFAKAQADKKEAEQRHARNRQYFIIAVLGTVIMAVITILLLLVRNNRQKQKANQVLETTLTHLRATQNRLIHAEKMASLGELTAGIAHEIQNPLNFVNNFSEVNTEMLQELKSEQAKPAAARDANMQADIINDLIANEQKINHHGKRADAIVKGMLQHSRTGTAARESSDINKLCDEYLRLAYQGLRAKDPSFHATLDTNFDKGIGNIGLIPQDIGRVLLNIINNALYAVAEKKKLQPQGYGPAVSIATKKLGDKVEIRIADNGEGIAQKILDKIFQPFFTTKPSGQGTGLGLSLAWDIIKAHGGELTVDSKTGTGSTFTILLPDSPPPAEGQ
jgi:two-component system NtrC family sensor kinase